MIATQVLPFKTKGVIIFSWVKGEDVIDEFMKSLPKLDMHSVPKAIVKYVFSHSETFAVNPDWWESQDAELRNYLIDLYHNYLPGGGLENNCLVVDRKLIDWSVIEVIES